MHGKTHKYEGMRHTYWYAAMSEDAVQRSRWTFYEVVNLNIWALFAPALSDWDPGVHLNSVPLYDHL